METKSVHEEELTLNGYPVTFRLFLEEEDTDPEGNFSSGDEELDRQTVTNIRADLDSGNPWAWFMARVTCTITLPNGETVEGSDTLGTCSYHGLKDFIQPDGYWPDMKAEAYREARSEISRRNESANMIHAAEINLPRTLKEAA